MSIKEQRSHISLLVRQEGFEEWMKKIKNRYANSYAMNHAIRRVQ